MKKIRTGTFILALIMSAALNLNATPLSVNGKLSVSGNYLVNSCGTQIQLRGVSSHGLQYYPNCHPTAALDYAASMGADVYRIAMYVGENGYLTNPASFTSQVDTLVDQVGARGMYAIIDWHILQSPTNDPNNNLGDATTFWAHEAAQHKGKPYVIYEICNEPNGVTWAQIRTYATSVINTIRAIDPDSIIIVGTPVWSQLGSDVVNNKLSSFTNIMYTFHFYAASHATSLLTPYAGQLPIFVTEWAASESSGNGTLNTGTADAFHTIMNNYKISWTSWSFSDAPETSAMFNSGTCSSGVYNDSKLSAEGNYVKGKMTSPADNFGSCGGGPTNTPVFTSTRTRTGTPTYTRTNGTTPTFTSTRTRTPTSTYTRTTGPSPTITRTFTATFTYTPTPAPSSVTAACGAGIVIDGNLSDAAWQTGAWTVNNRLVTGTNPQGVTSQFKVRWDNTNLYVAVDVTDSTPFNDSGANWYDDSSVEVYLDMNHNHSTAYQADDFQFSVRYNDAVIREQGGKQGAAAGATAVRAGGYTVEMRLPWTVLGVTPAAAAVYGFDAGVNVDSGGGVREGVLMWNGTANNYADTSAFADLVLGPVCPVSTPTFTITRTSTFTFTRTGTPTYTRTAVITPTFTYTRTASATFTRTNTPVNSSTSTPVNTATFTRTNTASATASVSPSNSYTRTPSATASVSPSNTYTRTPTPSYTRTWTASASPSFTYSRTPTNTPANTGTFTRTSTPINTPTNTPVNTATFTRTNTPVNTPTYTATVTRTNTPVNTATNTPVNTATYTRSVTSTYSRTVTVTFTRTSTATPTYTRTASSTFTRTATPTFTRTSTATQTYTATATFTKPETPSTTPSISPTWTGTPPSPTFTPTITKTWTNTASPTSTGTFTRTSTASVTPQNTFTNTQTRTATASVSPQNTFTNTETRTSTPVNTSTFTRTATNTPVNTATDTPANTHTFTATATPTYSLTFTFTLTATPTFTRTSTPTFTRTRTPTSSFTLTLTPNLSPTSTPTITVTWTGTPPTSTVTPTITVTSTKSQVPSETLTSTDTPVDTETVTPSVTVTSTASRVSSETATPTLTRTLTNTPVNTATLTSTRTNTPANTATNTVTSTIAQTPSPSASASPSPSYTRTYTPVNTMTNTPLNTATPSFTLTLTLTIPVVPTATRTPVIVPTRDTFEIINPVIFPNPYNPASGIDANFRCDLTRDAANIKIKIYTTGFRAVKEINIPGVIKGGTVDRIVAAREFSRLANAVYFFVVTGENGQGKKSKTQPETLVILK